MKLTRNLCIALGLWAVLITAIALNEMHPFINTVEVILGVGLVLWRSICVFTYKPREGDKPTEKRILVGLPNWYSRFLLDEKAKAKDEPRN
jgi:hypothetical protein